MSSDSHVLAASTVAGIGTFGLAAVAHSRNALLIGLAIAFVVLLVLGFLARRFAKRDKKA